MREGKEEEVEVEEFFSFRLFSFVCTRGVGGGGGRRMGNFFLVVVFVREGRGRLGDEIFFFRGEGGGGSLYHVLENI